MHAWHPRAPRPRAATRLAAVALLVAAPALTSCGFDRPTSKINQITAGDSERGASVDVLNVLIVSERPGSGTLVGLLVNNDQTESVALETVMTGPDAAPASVQRLEINPGGRRQLSEAEIRVDGAFRAGEVHEVVLGFSTGEEVELGAQVVPACEEYAGLDDAPSAAGTTAGSETESETYSCEYEEPVELH